MKTMIKQSIKFFIPLFIFLILIAPTFSFGARLVPCTNNCDFNAFMDLINNVIRFALFDLVVPIAAIMFFYAGFLLITAGGAEAKTKAKGIFTNAVIGLVVAAGAWIIIRTILSILGYDGAWIGFPK